VSDELEPEVEPGVRWERVDGCTCNAALLGPGGHESSCGWVEVTE